MLPTSIRRGPGHRPRGQNLRPGLLSASMSGEKDQISELSDADALQIARVLSQTAARLTFATWALVIATCVLVLATIALVIVTAANLKLASVMSPILGLP